MGMKKLIIALTVLAGISVIVCIVSIAMYMNKNNRSADELLDLGQSYLEDGDYEQAVASLEAALEIDAKEVSDENPELRKNHDEVIGLLADAYIAWADEEEEKGDAELAQEIRNKGFEKTGDKRLGLVLDDNDIYNYIGRWDELADVLGVPVVAVDEDEFIGNYFENKDGFQVSWTADDEYSQVYNEDASISILDFRPGDSVQDVERKMKTIEVNYDAWGTYGDKYGSTVDDRNRIDSLYLYDDKKDTYYGVQIIYGEDRRVASVSLYYASDYEVGMDNHADIIRSQRKYGKVSQYSWNASYLHFITNVRYRMKGQRIDEEWKYRLLYVNDDEIPELYIKRKDYENNLEDDVIVTADGTSIEEDTIEFVVGDISYIEKENIVMASGSYGGNTWHDRIISIENGKFQDNEMGENGYTIVDPSENNGEERLDWYRWSEKDISQEEYETLKRQAFNEEKAQSIYDIPEYDTTEIIEKLVKMGNNIKDEDDEKRNTGIILEGGETKKIDLNGGEKEEVVCRYYEDNDSAMGGLDFLVNGKNVFSKSCEGDSGFPPSISVQIIDANKNDSYKEIFYVFTGDSYVIKDKGFFRYGNNGKIKECPMDIDGWAGEYYRGEDLLQSDNMGNIYINMDTPFANSTFGSYYLEVKGNLDATGFHIKNEESYPVIDDYMEYNGEFYELNKSVILYKDFNGAQMEKKLPKGTKFSALSIHPITEGVRKDEFHRYDLYVQIETVDGQIGWVFFPKDGRDYNEPENDILVYTPAWG